MDSPERSPKRRCSGDGYVESPPRRRSLSRSPAHASPKYNLTERPARRSYSRGDSDEDADRRYYRGRRSTRSRSRRRSRSPSVAIATPPPEKPTQLHFKPHLILRGHKKGVAAVKFSPDGRWIASCCELDAELKHAWGFGILMRFCEQLRTRPSRYGTRKAESSCIRSKAIWRVYLP
jgi:COMPASS component SWD3